MGKKDETTSKTERVQSNIVDKIVDKPTYKTTITNKETGEKVSGLGNTPEDSQKTASDKRK
jgi:hypothetical protein